MPALTFLTHSSDQGVLPVTDEVLNDLKMKHPAPAPIQPNILLNGPLEQVPTNYFDSIDEATIRKASKMTNGAAGPSQFDADQYRRILCSKTFKTEGKDLREQIAILARNVASNLIDPDILDSYVACRLIPLNKNPGVRPIGIGEILRRIVGKAIFWVLNPEIQEAAGPLQASTGLKGGAEAAIHVMKDIFNSDDTDGIILVDASNAFNLLNRQVAPLHNIQFTCPPFATVLINTYRKSSRLIISGGVVLKYENELDNAKILFSNTAIKLATNGKRHLGAALGTKTFKDEYVKKEMHAEQGNNKVSCFCQNATSRSIFCLYTWPTTPFHVFSTND